MYNIHEKIEPFDFSDRSRLFWKNLLSFLTLKIRTPSSTACLAVSRCQIQKPAELKHAHSSTNLKLSVTFMWPRMKIFLVTTPVLKSTALLKRTILLTAPSGFVTTVAQPQIHQHPNLTLAGDFFAGELSLLVPF